MIEFLEIEDDDPALAHSPMVRGIEKTFDYIAKHGFIGLTPLKAFKRNFVHWAADEFDWPHCSTKDLFSVNKVLNEMDFLPLMCIHETLKALKIGRHHKGTFMLTKVGKSLVGHRGKVFGIVAPFFLFHVDHGYLARDDERLVGNWDIFMNVLNVETQNGATGAEIRKILYGAPELGERFDHVWGRLYIEVLRPLCWVGLLSEHRTKDFGSAEETIFTKTPLWKAALRLDTDHMLRQATLH